MGLPQVLEAGQPPQGPPPGPKPAPPSGTPSPQPGPSMPDPSTPVTFGDLGGFAGNVSKELENIHNQIQALKTPGPQPSGTAGQESSAQPAPPEAGNGDSDAKQAKELSELFIKESIAATGKQYEKAFKDQSNNRKEFLNRIKQKIFKVGRWAGYFSAAYAGASIYAGLPILEALTHLPRAFAMAAALPGKALGEATGWVGKQDVGLFDVPETRIGVKIDQQIEKLAPLEVTSNIELFPKKEDGGPVYKFFEGIIGKGAAGTITKMVGTPLVSFLGRGVIAKGITYATVPLWGQTILPILGAPLLAMGALKAAKWVRNTYRGMTKAGQLESSERANLQSKLQEYRNAGKNAEAEIVRRQIEALPGKVQGVREGMVQKQVEGGRANRLQEAIALRI